jgi:hypothetical protein
MRVEGDMPETGDQPNPPKPVRTWRPMVAWTLGILAALGLAWFVGAVAVPVWTTKAIVTAYATQEIDEPTAIERLGGQEAAARRLALYLRMPKCWRHRPTICLPTDEADEAAFLLFACGRPGALVVPRLLESRDAEILRAVSCWGLGGLHTRHPDGQHPWLDPELYTRTLAGLVQVTSDRESGDETLRWDVGEGLVALLRVRPVPGIPKAAVPHLVRALEAESIAARCAAIAALADSGDPRSRPAVEVMLMDGERAVSSAAAEALKKIRGE